MAEAANAHKELEADEEEDAAVAQQAGNFFGDDSDSDSDGDADDEKAEPKEAPKMMNLEKLPFAKRQELQIAESLLAQ